MNAGKTYYTCKLFKIANLFILRAYRCVTYENLPKIKKIKKILDRLIQYYVVGRVTVYQAIYLVNIRVKLAT